MSDQALPASEAVPAAATGSEAAAVISMAPGFRFHPSDEELVGYYLKRKVENKPLPFDVIGEADVYNMDPSDLAVHSKLTTNDQELFFFCAEPYRATKESFWEKTGRYRKIKRGADGELIGMIRSLVFYDGRYPDSQQTNWVMHEYHLVENDKGLEKQIDAYVLCRVFLKEQAGPHSGCIYAPFSEQEWEEDDDGGGIAPGPSGVHANILNEIQQDMEDEELAKVFVAESLASLEKFVADGKRVRNVGQERSATTRMKAEVFRRDQVRVTDVIKHCFEHFHTFPHMKELSERVFPEGGREREIFMELLSVCLNSRQYGDSAMHGYLRFSNKKANETSVKSSSFQPKQLYVDDEVKLTLSGLVQHHIKLKDKEKKRKLKELLHALDFNQVVIFVNTDIRASELEKFLVQCNFPSISFHSGISRKEKSTRYKSFKEGHKRILVATDLVGNGVDSEQVTIVVNYDMPDSADTYRHRVGRDSRFGTKGLAITFVTSDSDLDFLDKVEERFCVDIKELPKQIDTSTYSNAVLK